jgi:hypothetical protein
MHAYTVVGLYMHNVKRLDVYMILEGARLS